MYQKPTPPNHQEIFAFTGEVFRTLKKKVEERGARLAVVYLPEAASVNQSLLEEKKKVLPSLASYEWDFDAPSRALAESLQDEGIPFLNLTPVFRKKFEEDPSAPLYANGDGHFREAGHQLVAEAVRPFIEEVLRAQ